MDSKLDSKNITDEDIEHIRIILDRKVSDTKIDLFLKKIKIEVEYFNAHIRENKDASNAQFIKWLKDIAKTTNKLNKLFEARFDFLNLEEKNTDKMVSRGQWTEFNSFYLQNNYFASPKAQISVAEYADITKAINSASELFADQIKDSRKNQRQYSTLYKNFANIFGKIWEETLNLDITNHDEDVCWHVFEILITYLDLETDYPRKTYFDFAKGKKS